jgi:hypothetical protein
MAERVSYQSTAPGYVLEPTRGYAHIADQGVPVRALMHQSRFERTL